MAESYFRLSNQKVSRSDQIAGDVIVDYDAQGGIVGLEFLSAEAAAKRDDYLVQAAKPSTVRLRAPAPVAKAASAA